MNNLIDKIKIYGIKKTIRFIFSEIKRTIIMVIIKESFSQKGEDLIIDKLLNYKTHGFYVDVGANDPDRFSNTKRFYLKGWTGINIDPNLQSIDKFKKKRAKDININLGVGNTSGTLRFYKFFPDTLSTFSEEESNNYLKQGYKLRDTIDIKVEKLSNILNKFINKKKIDFISIDTEGFDLEVLKSNDWEKYKPKCVCIETESHDIESQKTEYKRKCHTFLLNIGYKLYIDNGLNSIYVHQN